MQPAVTRLDQPYPWGDTSMQVQTHEPVFPSNALLEAASTTRSIAWLGWAHSFAQHDWGITEGKCLA